MSDPSSLPNYHAKLSENPAFTQLEPDPSIWERLTPREKEVFCLVADGLTDKEVARHLNVAVGTAKAHLRRLYALTRATTRTGLVKKVCRTLAPIAIGNTPSMVSRETTERAA